MTETTEETNGCANILVGAFILFGLIIFFQTNRIDNQTKQKEQAQKYDQLDRMISDPGISTIKKEIKESEEAYTTPIEIKTPQKMTRNKLPSLSEVMTKLDNSVLKYLHDVETLETSTALVRCEMYILDQNLSGYFAIKNGKGLYNVMTDSGPDFSILSERSQQICEYCNQLFIRER